MKIELDIKNYDDSFERYFPKSMEQKISEEQAMYAILRNELARLGQNLAYPLSQIGIPDAAGWDGGLCLHRETTLWLVYHSERGLRSDVSVFTSVQNAVNFFLWRSVSSAQADNSSIGYLCPSH
jgi:hypothetical protein